MPKNKGAGGKKFKKSKNSTDEVTRELVFKEDGTEYGKVLKMLGGSQVEVYCYDEKVRKCHIRNKKVWISVGDILLIGLREFEKSVGDVIHKYDSKEIQNLINYGELPQSLKDSNLDKNIEDIIFETEDDELN